MRAMTLFGGYELVRRLGKGTYGEVWEAHDVKLGRAVAVKLLTQGSDEDVARFKREARLASRLTHPNIATLYEVGEVDGRPYLAMQKVDGVAIGSDAHPVRRRVEALRDAARAVHYAHGQGIIHRDLKPDNLLVDGDGRAFVLDFGLARPIAGGGEDPLASSLSGRVVGTPAFMPPEQAMGRRHEVGARSDVFGLGATLYFVLTGRPPFEGKTEIEVLRAAIHDDPAPSATVNVDLMTVAMRAMEKDPERRYATAEELADELDRWLRGEPIQARPPGLADRVFKHVRREPALWSVGIALGATVFTGAGWGIDAWLRQQKALEERVGAERARIESQRASEEERERVRVTLLRVEALEQANAGLDDVDSALAARLEDTALAQVRERIRGAIASLDAGPRDEGSRYLKGRAYRMLEMEAEALAELKGVTGEEGTPWGKAVDVGTRAAYERLRCLLNQMVDTRSNRGDEEIVEASQYTKQVLTPAILNECRRIGEGRLADELRAVADLWEICLTARSEDEGYGAVMARADEEIGKGGNTADVYFMRALVEYEHERPEEALRNLDTAILRHSGRSRYYYIRGFVRESIQQHGPAIGDFTQAIRLNPGHFLALHDRAVAYDRWGRGEDALRDYDAALVLRPRHAYTIADRAFCLKALGRGDEAVKEAGRAVEINPRVVSAWNLLSMDTLDRGDFKSAAEILTKAIAANPNEYTLRCDRGTAYRNLGDVDLAVADFKASIALKDNAAAHNGLGNVLLNQGDLPRAKEEYDRAIELDSQGLSAICNRAWAQYGMKDPRGAIRDAERALEVNPEHAEAYRVRGAARYELSEFEGAALDYTEVLKRVAPNAELLCLRGFAYAGWGKKPEAIADLERALELAPAGWARAKQVREVLTSLKGDEF